MDTLVPLGVLAAYGWPVKAPERRRPPSASTSRRVLLIRPGKRSSAEHRAGAAVDRRAGPSGRAMCSRLPRVYVARLAVQAAGNSAQQPLDQGGSSATPATPTPIPRGRGGDAIALSRRMCTTSRSNLVSAFADDVAARPLATATSVTPAPIALSCRTFATSRSNLFPVVAGCALGLARLFVVGDGLRLGRFERRAPSQRPPRGERSTNRPTAAEGAVRGYTMNKDDYLRRLRRVEGQVRGLQRMIGDDAYCVDLLTQFAAVTKALQSVAVGVLDEHIRHCVREATTDDAARADEMITEATRAIERLVRL
jgi:CsoR family transcriptional regulator, copper-sensing transcriptional repressor